MNTKFWSIKNAAIIAILTLLVIPVTILAQEDDQEAKKIFNKALEAQQAGDDSLAVMLYDGTIAEDPNFTDAYINLGSIYFGRNDFAKAATNFKKATETDATSADAWANLGRTYYKQQKYDDAMNCYNTAISNNAEYFEIYKDLGLVQFVKKDWASLVASMTKFTEHFTDDYLPYYLMGKGYQKLKKFDESITNYKKAIALKPGDYNCHNSLGQIYQEQEKFDKAYQSFKKASQIKSDKYLAFYNMAWSYQMMNQDAEGNLSNVDTIIEHWNKFLKSAKNNPKAKSYVKSVEATVTELKEYKEF